MTKPDALKARLHIHEATEQLADAMDALPPALRAKLCRNQQDEIIRAVDELRRVARALERGVLRPPKPRG